MNAAKGKLMLFSREGTTLRKSSIRMLRTKPKQCPLFATQLLTDPVHGLGYHGGTQ